MRFVVTQILCFVLALILSAVASLAESALAQEPTPPPAATPAEVATVAPANPGDARPSKATQKIILPAGTRLPLVLRNGINTRTAKAGDAVYFETVYPIAQSDRIVIPVGSFVQGS